MDPHEAAAVAAAHADHAHQWSLGGQFGRAFGPVIGDLVRAEGGGGPADTVEAALAAHNAHALCLTVPAHWFDVSAERICDIMHTKSVYALRAAAYANNGAAPAAPQHDMMRAYAVQMFFQIAFVLWRWRDRNDRLAWGSASESDSSESEDDRPRRKKHRKRKRPRILGRARDDCGMAVDWRWRAVCSECAAVRDQWSVVFCDHAARPEDMSPVLDYTFWFVARGWREEEWAARVGRAAVAVIRRMHLGADEPAAAARAPDGSDAWKDICTPEGFSTVALTYLQAMRCDRRRAYARHAPRGGVTRFADLLGGCNPARVYAPAVSRQFWTGAGCDTRALLGATCIEVQPADACAWRRFWWRYLPHHDLLCARPFSSVFPGVYHPTLADLEAAVIHSDALRTIGSGGAPDGGGAPVRTNADTTTIWRLAHEAAGIAADGAARLQAACAGFAPEERAAAPAVWRHMARKRALVKYVLQCRTPESHLSHSLVGMWAHYHSVGGAVYDPASIRPAHGAEHAECPWDYYYRNLTPFGNWMVNHAYHLWNHFYVDPPQVATSVLVLDAAANATRGERYNVGLNPLVFSTDPKAGKSFVTGELLARTRVPGTWTASSYKSAGAQHIQRMGTHDDMVVYVDEVKRGMFVSKADGGMADPKQKELMTNGFVQSHVLVFTGGAGTNDRGEQTYTYNELGTLVATGNQAFMDVPDKAFLSRWIMLPHNKCPPGVAKRPRVAPRPPLHVVQQMHQLQLAVTEVHKLVQIGAMDPEDTTVVDIMLEALGDGLRLGPDTQRRDMQIKNLARVHAIRDCIVTHFWLPGGLFYKQRIAPSRLFALNDFLVVRAEHVVFAIGQLCNSAADSTQYAVARAIVELWRAPGGAVAVKWARGAVAHDTDDDGRLGFAPQLALPCYDAVVFEGQGRGFLRHFCATLHYIISAQLAVPERLKSVPTADQIESHLRRWMGEMHAPMRAVARGGALLTRPCHPDAIEFTDAPIPPEMQCTVTEAHGVVRIRFPTHMLCTASAAHNAIAGTPLEAMLAFSGAGGDATAPRCAYLYGGVIPGRQECYAVLPLTPPESAAPPMLPYRHYEGVLTHAEYVARAGAPPPPHRDTPVRMLFPLDEFAARARIRTVQGLRAGVAPGLFARVAAKLVIGGAHAHTAHEELAPLLRTTAMVWGAMCRAPASALLADMHSAVSSDAPAEPLCADDATQQPPSAALTAVQRAHAMARMRCAYETAHNAYSAGPRYPDALPSILAPERAPEHSAPNKRARTQPPPEDTWIT